jgi:Na+/proline symporter
MSSTASGLNALASTTAIDIYKRNLKEEKSEKHYLNATKFYLVLGCCSHSFASVGTLFENLIQLVNIVGSIFYGTVLGIFLVGFYIKFVKAKAIFTVPWSAKSPFSLYIHAIFFPAGEAGLFMAKLHRGNAYDRTVFHTSTVCFRKKKDNIS